MVVLGLEPLGLLSELLLLHLLLPELTASQLGLLLPRPLLGRRPLILLFLELLLLLLPFLRLGQRPEMLGQLRAVAGVALLAGRSASRTNAGHVVVITFRNGKLVVVIMVATCCRS